MWRVRSRFNDLHRTSRVQRHAHPLAVQYSRHLNVVLRFYPSLCRVSRIFPRTVACGARLLPDVTHIKIERSRCLRAYYAAVYARVLASGAAAVCDGTRGVRAHTRHGLPSDRVITRRLVLVSA